MKTEDRYRAGAKARGQSAPRKVHIFEIAPRDPNYISTDTVKTELYHHGYRVIKSVGEGAYAKVKLAEVMAKKLARNEALADMVETTNALTVAIKVVNKQAVAQEFVTKFLPRELENHSQLQPHKNVVRVFESINTRDNVYIVMDYCPNGDLLDLINRHIGENQKGIGEEKSRRLFAQLCSAVQHIHNAGVVHRDIKCENVLLDENGDLKLTDFGFSYRYDEKDTMLSTSCGSFAYTAPEVIRANGYNGFRSDIWSLGVILFAMVNGRLPFNDAQLVEMEEEMKMQRLRFERNISFECMTLIRKLLQFSPQNRPNIGEVLRDCWLTGKKPIPRQLNRPQVEPSVNSTEEKKKHNAAVKKSSGQKSQPACYKTLAHRQTAVTGTVTLNQEAGETVFLKSRRQYSPKRPNTWPVDAKANPQGSPPPHRRSPTRKQRTKVTNAQTSPNPRQAIEAMLDRRIREGEDTDFSKKVPLWLIQKVLETEQEAKKSDKKETENGKVQEQNHVVEKRIQKKHCNEKPFIGRKQHDPAVKDNPKPEAICPACTACGQQATVARATSPAKIVVAAQHKVKRPAAQPQPQPNVDHRKNSAVQNPPKESYASAKPVANNKVVSPPIKSDLLNIEPHPPPKPRSAAVPQRRRLIFLKDESAQKETAMNPGTKVRVPNVSQSEGKTSSHPSKKKMGGVDKKERCAVLKKVSPELPPKFKEPTRAVVREQDPTPAERARSCRNRLMEIYGNNDTASDKKPLPPLVVNNQASMVKAGRNGLQGNPKPPSATSRKTRLPESSIASYSRSTPPHVRRKVVIHYP
ncbi:serine/threonine-protein kinase MARK2-like [Crassostrea angulata]|uniref:serine/threonine-protein kinase MARK2-like n=1 Tax=Magallana angulata TaxID=2784310 RepID=UPI0022B09AE8|nr:serine/threonine-protein kinase MARK2-like [Crassostrea angulata]